MPAKPMVKSAACSAYPAPPFTTTLRQQSECSTFQNVVKLPLKHGGKDGSISLFGLYPDRPSSLFDASEVGG